MNKEEMDEAMPRVEEAAPRVEEAAPRVEEVEEAAPRVEEVEEAAPRVETVERAEVDRLVAEAEERGYIRGRTEALNERLAGPDLYQEPECRNPVTILAGIRESVWN